MERRIYFVIGDLTACALAGAATGWLGQFLIPADWFVPLGMLIGTAIGMFIGMLSGLLLSPLFGAFEVMLPAALGGMLAGMTVAMLHAVIHLSPADSALTGAVAGLAGLAFTYVLQNRLHGEAA